MNKVAKLSFTAMLVGIILVGLSGCSRYAASHREGRSFLETYQKPVRWAQGEAAVREDVRAFAEASPMDNYLGYYLEREGADDCKETMRFPWYMRGLGYVDTLGSRETFCIKGDLGMTFLFRETDSKRTELENMTFFPSYLTLPEGALARMAERARAVVAPDRLDPGPGGEDTAARRAAWKAWRALLAAMPYDVAVIDYMETAFGTSCNEDKVYKFQSVSFECSGGGVRGAFWFDLFGRDTQHIVVNIYGHSFRWTRMDMNAFRLSAD